MIVTKGLNTNPVEYAMLTKLMIVEDEALIAFELRESLQDMGYEVTTIAGSGEEAIESAGEHCPDIILMDIHLSGEIDGIEAAKTIRSRLNIPTVFLTGFSNEELVQRAKEAMPVGYILKPVKDYELRVTLEIALYVSKVDLDRRVALESKRRSEKELKIRNTILEIFLRYDDDSIFEQVLNIVLSNLESEFGVFGFFNTEGHFVVPFLTRKAFWDKCRIEDKNYVFEYGKFNSIWSKAVQEKRTIYDNSGFFSVPDGHVTINNTLVSPMLFGGKTIGAIQVANKVGGYDNEDKDTLEMLINHIAPVLNARLERDFEEEQKKTAQTKLERQEQSYRVLVENLQEGIWVIDRNLNTVFVNPRMAEMLGYQAFEFVSITLPDVFEKKDEKSLSEMLLGPSPNIYKTIDATLLHKAGFKIYVKISFSHLSNNASESNELILLAVNDISDRVHYEAELKITRDQAEMANRAKSTFISNMSHELRTPLNSVIGYSELLLQELYGKLTAAQREYTSNIREAGDHLLTLINDIIDFSKDENGISELCIETIDIEELLDEGIHFLKQTANQKSIRIDIDKPYYGMPVIFEGDRTKIRQIIIKLLDNALKFSRMNSVIRLKHSVEEDNIIIVVSDSGIGIEKDQQPLIFESFYQINSGSTGKTPGTGLGLSVVKRLVELHQGSIHVESEGPDKGCHFVVKLPKQQVIG